MAQMYLCGSFFDFLDGAMVWQRERIKELCQGGKGLAKLVDLKVLWKKIGNGRHGKSMADIGAEWNYVDKAHIDSFFIVNNHYLYEWLFDENGNVINYKIEFCNRHEFDGLDNPVLFGGE
jgi:hypothetical protein